jgi:ribonuclease HI
LPRVIHSPCIIRVLVETYNINIPVGCYVVLVFLDSNCIYHYRICQADTDEITHEKVWEKNYTVEFPTDEINMVPSGDIDAYTDGSLMGGRSGAGAFILRKSGSSRSHFCSLRGNTKQATVFQSEMIAVKAAAEALITNDPSGKRIVFHIDNQATLKTLDSTDITKRTSKETRETINRLGRTNTVVLEWVKAHVGILGNEEADKLAKAGETPLLYWVLD